MNVRKASGPDGIPPRVLRECASELASVLVQLYSLCLNTNTFPQCWKRALVQPIPKKGSRSDPSNYRPIPLTCILSKIFETLLSSHFLDHLESHSLLSDHQYGFRPSRSMSFGARRLLVIYFPISQIYCLLPLGTMGRLVWLRLTY